MGHDFSGSRIQALSREIEQDDEWILIQQALCDGCRKIIGDRMQLRKGRERHDV